MKRIFFSLLCAGSVLAPFFASSQTVLKNIASKVTDTTAYTVPSGYGALRYKNQGGYTKWQYTNNGTTWLDFGSGGGDESTTNKATTLSTMNDTLYPTVDALFQSRTVVSADAIVQSDNGGMIYFNSGTPFNFTIDALTAKTQVGFINIGSATVTFVNGAGVTFSGSSTLAGGSNASAAIVYHTSTAPIILSGGAGGSGTVTSVAASVPSIFSISGSPITTSGTLAMTYSGTALPVANGGTGITSFGTGVASALGANVSGSGSIAMTTSPVFTTPALGTPSALVGTNITGTATGFTSGITNALKSATTTVDVSAATAPTNGQVLTATSGTAATWQTPSSGFSDPMTTRGDIIYRNASNTTARLGAGTVNQVLTSDGTDISWAAAAGGGTWGSITGTLSAQTDLQTALDSKWSLASGGTLTGVNTISNPTANGLIYSGSPTFSADGHYFKQVIPTLQFGSTLAHVQGALNIGGTYTAGVNNQVLRGLVINPTYAYGAFARASYSQLGLDIRDGGTANGGFKFYTDAFTNSTQSFQIISRTGVTTLEQAVDSGGAAIITNAGKNLTIGIGGGALFRWTIGGSRMFEVSSPTLDVSRTLLGPAWSGTATTSTATQQNPNANFATQFRLWNGAAAVTGYELDATVVSTSVNQLWTTTKKFWNGASMTNLWKYSSAGGMFLGGDTDPTATLHLAAGTATRAPLKLTSGTNLTTAEAGAIEFNGTDLLFTPVSTRSRVLLQTSEMTNKVILDANASRKTYEMKWVDGGGASGNQDWDLFLGLTDAVIEVTFKVVGIKDDGSEIYTATKSASFKKDGAAAPVMISTATTIAEVVEDGVDNPNTTISIASGLVRLAYSTGSADIYTWTVFATVTQTIL